MKRSLGTPYQCPTLPYPAPRSVRHPAPSRSRPLPYTVSRVLCPVSSVQCPPARGKEARRVRSRAVPWSRQGPPIEKLFDSI